jgi:AraC-like DNA-binding protein
VEHHKYDSRDDRFHVDLTGQIRMEMAGMVDCPMGWTGQLHCHPFWELVYINAGRGELRTSGRVISFRKSSLFLLPPLGNHQFVNAGRDRMEIFYIGFGSESRALGHFDPDLAPVLDLEEARDLLTGRLERLVESIKTAKTGCRTYEDQALLYEIVYRLLVFFQDRPARSHAADRSGAIAEKAKRYLESNVHRSVSVEEVAAKFYLSPHYFAKTFRDEAGCGLKDFHNRARMEKALELLADPRLPISRVAARLGFGHVTYFTNRFRERHGLTPSEWRRGLVSSGKSGPL